MGCQTSVEPPEIEITSKTTCPELRSILRKSSQPHAGNVHCLSEKAFRANTSERAINPTLSDTVQGTVVRKVSFDQQSINETKKIRTRKSRLRRLFHKPKDDADDVQDDSDEELELERVPPQSRWRRYRNPLD
mmetsp:Transcript_28490/g.53399  ORF Transcript_28490/g.53399 Transcript_28490/m.53399 type:complete len:133 (-) Transcript_28490:352-750(-)